MRGPLLALALLGLADAQIAANATITGTTTGSSAAGTPTTTTGAPTPGLSTQIATAGGISVRALARGGQTTAYSLSETEPNRVTVYLQAIRELDAQGIYVGTIGATKHFVQGFSTQDFILYPPAQTAEGTAMVTNMSMSAAAGAIGRVRITAMSIVKAGAVGPGLTAWNAWVGDVLWRLELFAWRWCGCVQGNVSQRGASVDVDLYIAGNFTNPRNYSSNQFGTTWDLGGGIRMELPTRMVVDGIDATMPKGYPRLNSQGATPTFGLRFPRFNTSVAFEALIRMASSSSVGVQRPLPPTYVSNSVGLATGRAVAVLKALALLAGLAASARPG